MRERELFNAAVLSKARGSGMDGGSCDDGARTVVLLLEESTVVCPVFDLSARESGGAVGCSFSDSSSRPVRVRLASRTVLCCAVFARQKHKICCT